MTGMNTMTTAPVPAEHATARAPWLVACDGDELAFGTSRAAAEHLADLAPHGLPPGAPAPFSVRYAGEDPVDYTGYVGDVFRATGWYEVPPAQRRSDEGRHWRELVVELTAAILVGE